MNKPLILVVEDDTPVRNLITTTLKTHEYRYLSAQNGASAVMEALSHNPDIVLLDLGLPDMDGVETVSYTHLDVYKRQVHEQKRKAHKIDPQVQHCFLQNIGRSL